MGEFRSISVQSPGRRGDIKINMVDSIQEHGTVRTSMRTFNKTYVLIDLRPVAFENMLVRS